MNVFESLDEPNLWIESFEVSNWAEHIAQHERVTVADSEKRARLHQFDSRESDPVVRHYLAPAQFRNCASPQKTKTRWHQGEIK